MPTMPTMTTMPTNTTEEIYTRDGWTTYDAHVGDYGCVDCPAAADVAFDAGIRPDGSRILWALCESCAKETRVGDWE